MSFSADIKSELYKLISSGRHCQLAELAAVIYFSGMIMLNPEGKPEILITSENKAVKRKYFTLSKKAFNIEADTEKILQALRIINDSEIKLKGTRPKICLSEGPSTLLLKNTCCRRAYLRGAFICTGSMSNPQSSNHLEFVISNEKPARQLKDILNGFLLDAKITKRKKYFVVYIKDGTAIVDLLNIMGAHNALLKVENLRVEKEVRNLVNRKVNCEAANIGKTISAAARQIEDISYIKDNSGFASLPDNLRQIAELRLEYPDATLQELGELLNPPIGKSGVNHRLRKLSDIAGSK